MIDTIDTSSFSKRLTEQELYKMKMLHKKGASKSKISKEIGCCEKTVSYWIEHNFQRHIQNDYNLENKVDIIQQMLNEGYTQEYIAIQCNCPKTTMFKFIHSHGFKKVTLKDKVNTLYENNYSNKDIAKQLGIHASVVAKYKKQIKQENTLKYASRLEDENKNLIEKVSLLEEENERLKRELEAAYQIDNYDSSDVPVLRRRIYDLEETFDAIKQHFNIGLAQMSSVRYTEYEKQESEDV